MDEHKLKYFGLNTKSICNKKMTFQECELAILHNSVKEAEKVVGKNLVSSPEVIKMISILEAFLKNKDLIIYGGTAINKILPENDKFYDYNVELPDYDVFSTEPMEMIIHLSNIYAKEGFTEVEAKSGVHVGTFKLYINFLPIADITYLHKEIFNAMKNDAIKKDGIMYAPPNFLRMSMFLELSRPQGQVERWEKVLKRMNLLNKNYPLKGDHCKNIEFQRDMENSKNEELIFDTMKKIFVKEDCVFFGGYALSMYSNYMPDRLKQKLKKYPDFDVLSIDPLNVAKRVKRELEENGIKNVKIVKKNSIGKIISEHYIIKIKDDFVAFIYRPLSCHSYNEIKEGSFYIKIATIDTMLSFYLAFLYSSREYYDSERILCASQYLFRVQQLNRLTQKGLLKRFTIDCYGHEDTLQEMREKKMKKYLELRKKPNSLEYKEYFFRYRPVPLVTPNSLNGNENAEVEPSSKANKTKKRKGNSTKSKKRGFFF